jgi:hypothetical protein
MVAAQHGHARVVELLISASADACRQTAADIARNILGSGTAPFLGSGTAEQCQSLFRKFEGQQAEHAEAVRKVR